MSGIGDKFANRAVIIELVGDGQELKSELDPDSIVGSTFSESIFDVPAVSPLSKSEVSDILTVGIAEIV